METRLKKAWWELPDKSRYLKWAGEDRVRYLAEMKQYYDKVDKLGKINSKGEFELFECE